MEVVKFRSGIMAIAAIFCAVGMISLPGCATTQQKLAARNTAQPVITATADTVTQSATAQQAAGGTLTTATALAAALHAPAAATRPGQAYAAQADRVKADAGATVAAVGVVAKSAAAAKSAADSLPSKIVRVEMQNVSVGVAKTKKTWSYQLGHGLLVWGALLLGLAVLVAVAELWGGSIKATTGILSWIGAILRLIAAVSSWIFGWVDTVFLFVWSEVQKIFGISIVKKTVTQTVTPSPKIGFHSDLVTPPKS